MNNQETNNTVVEQKEAIKTERATTPVIVVETKENKTVEKSETQLLEEILKAEAEKSTATKIVKKKSAKKAKKTEKKAKAKDTRLISNTEYLKEYAELTIELEKDTLIKEKRKEIQKRRNYIRAYLKDHREIDLRKKKAA